VSTPEQPSGSPPASNRQIGDIVQLIQQLTSRGLDAEGCAGLIAGAFAALWKCMPFDVGVAVMLEQNLDLHISTRAGAEALVDEDLVGRIRGTLQTLIPAAFTTTDIVVVSERHDLPQRGDAAGLAQEVHSTLTVEGRTAGLLLIYRDAPPFTPDQKQILEIFSAQMSLLIANMNAREKILNLADTDYLTGIWNKRSLRRQMIHETERARTHKLPLCVLLLDIDDFKQINDILGHTIGDVVLSEFCGAVREMLRPPDFFARFGGDEFVVVLPHTDLIGAASVAERILERVRDLTITTDEETAVACSVSIGVADFHLEDETQIDVLRRADERLYVAKRRGKNRMVAEDVRGEER
jgi:diguanylate cyclase (GGDEF)-like protein